MAANDEARPHPHGPAMTAAAAHKFAAAWLDAFNAHDLDRILAHYADDVVFTSPVARDLMGLADGTIVGGDALRAYFARALGRYPDLAFSDATVLVGATSLVLVYNSRYGGEDHPAAETMVLDRAGRAARVLCHYEPARLGG